MHLLNSLERLSLSSLWLFFQLHLTTHMLLFLVYLIHPHAGMWTNVHLQIFAAVNFYPEDTPAI